MRVLAGGAPVAIMTGTSIALPRARRCCRSSAQLEGAGVVTTSTSPATSTGAAAPPPTDHDDHLRDLIEQVLFTSPGERVMRPDFGSGLLALVFEPGGPEARPPPQYLVQGALRARARPTSSPSSPSTSRRSTPPSGDRSLRRTTDAGARDRHLRGAGGRAVTRYVCCNERRLLAVQERGPARTGSSTSRCATPTSPPAGSAPAHPVRPAAAPRLPGTLGPTNVVIDGGERIPTVDVEWATAATALPPPRAAFLLDGLDDPRPRPRRPHRRSAATSPATGSRLVAGARQPAPPPGFDPLLAEVEFSFKVECPTDFDCAAECTCPPGVHHAPLIDYLAKDYQGFRRLMLDRLSLLAPEWTERAAADVGITLVELLAYVADELSYRQDAVATEAYLDDAPGRVSLRRHARLVDYRGARRLQRARLGAGGRRVADGRAAGRHHAAVRGAGAAPADRAELGRPQDRAGGVPGRVRDRRARPSSTST